MTEAEWYAASQPEQLSPFLSNRDNTRKFRLFSIACCYRVRHRFNPWEWGLVEAAEAFLEGLGPLQEVVRQRDSIAEADLWMGGASAAYYVAGGDPYQSRDDHTCAQSNYVPRYHWYEAERASHECGSLVLDNEVRCREIIETPAEVELELRAHTDLVRDIFGNPFRPVTAAPAWLTSDVVALARGIYDGRAFDRLPILADALQDAGCEHPDVLSHCRDAHLTHVRGCWVVDLLLGKS